MSRDSVVGNADDTLSQFGAVHVIRDGVDPYGDGPFGSFAVRLGPYISISRTSPCFFTLRSNIGTINLKANLYDVNGRRVRRPGG